MRKSEIFAHILNVVSEETELKTDVILSDSKRCEVVDARYLLVFFLFIEGLRSSEIAGLIKRSTRYVNFILADFQDRAHVGKQMRKQRESIGKQLGSN